jgi:hypothetical protein
MNKTRVDKSQEIGVKKQPKLQHVNAGKENNRPPGLQQRGNRYLDRILSYKESYRPFLTLQKQEDKKQTLSISKGAEIKAAEPSKEPSRIICTEVKKYIDRIHHRGELLTETQVRRAVRIQFRYLRDNFYMQNFKLLAMKLASGPLGRTNPVAEYQGQKLILCKRIEWEARQQVFDYLRGSGEPLMPKETSNYARLEEFPMPRGY